MTVFAVCAFEFLTGLMIHVVSFVTHCLFGVLAVSDCYFKAKCTKDKEKTDFEKELLAMYA
jgi:hypothetical protein